MWVGNKKMGSRLGWVGFREGWGDIELGLGEVQRVSLGGFKN